ncbi:hypothetical protein CHINAEXTREME_10660 [Halobiforma lacisalsi AJ5]|uniref:Uncharacterized protein n=1 Tax=Natronobacterium lacisalsi AJ5 TaxID=358396 RepID=M0L519_NATLA|nr:hypothetical protein [Halobiforma lacisalsi]APW98222.1 hypothetical protein CHINAEXTREME_10660 [Halobiforma lacisalsi AJ5]EMA28208.1 hypothetical protein C445_19253 [Halobiforma lacisalsi AJ5]
MTDGTIEDDAGKPGGVGGGGIEFASSADELFGGIADESLGDPSIDDRSGDGTDEGGDDDDADAEADAGDGIEDRTAASVFGELKDTVGNDADTDGLLDGETPDDIIASADEPEPEPGSETEADEDILADEGELEDLLLTGRTEGQEFLWVDPPGEGDDETDGESAVKLDWEANVETATDTEAEPTPVESDGDSDSDGDGNGSADGTADRDEGTAANEPSSSDSDLEDTAEERAEPLEDAGDETASAEPEESEGENESESAVTDASVEAPDESSATDGGGDGEDGDHATAATDSVPGPDPDSDSDPDPDPNPDSDSATPGLFRRLLSKLNPF